MMLRSLLKREKTPPKQNKVLKRLRNKVFIQGAIAVQTLIIAVALIFGMSAAWYNNVLQTSGLQFQAEAWGFSGQVTVVNPSDLEVAPGDSGIVGIIIQNANDQMLDATVRVTKDQMPREMQQRMFFYVDSPVTRNGETMDRVYVNAVSGYTYTVLEDTSLVITEERKNDAPLQWQWVYDMLGYYFLGTVAEGTAQVEEYLRPVEYDLDCATFSADGQLKTVDGITTKTIFLQRLAATDGYAGEITAVDDMPGYYQVSVDENGYGVWIYLCDQQDIEDATAYDTRLGLQAAQGVQESCPAVVSLVGQPTQILYTQAATAEEVDTALRNGEMVQLSQDLILSEALTIETVTQSILDLNGHTISGPQGDVALRLAEGSQLTILGGTIEGGDAGKDVISVSGSDLTLHNVTIAGDGDDAVDVVDRGGKTDSRVRMFHCNIDVGGCAVYVCGNGQSSDGRTAIVIEESVLNSGYITVMGNGTSTNWGTDIQIYRSTLTGYFAAIYQPQGDSVTTVTESNLSGHTAIALKAGELVIHNSTVTGTGITDMESPGYAASGFNQTGDAIYVEDGYKVPIKLRISGDNTRLQSTADNTLALRVFAENSPYVEVQITGGSFSSDVSAYVADGFVYANGTVTKKEGG